MSKAHAKDVAIRDPADQPRAVEGGADCVKVELVSGEWKTPGSLIAQGLARLPQVRLVAERYEGARYGVFVILDGDADEVLDVVFETEQQVMREIPNIPFDLRVRKPHAQWSPDDLLATCLKHYSRL